MLTDQDKENQRLINELATREPSGSYNRGFERGAGFVFLLAMMILLLIVFSK